MFTLICGLILGVIFAEAKFYSTEVGIGSGGHFGIGPYGGRYTNIEYGGNLGYPHGVGQSGYTQYGSATPNVAYGQGILPQNPGFGVGPATVGLGHGFDEGLKTGRGYPLARADGYDTGFGGIKTGGAGLGFGGSVAGIGYNQYPSTLRYSNGVGYGSGFGYGQSHPVGLEGYAGVAPGLVHINGGSVISNQNYNGGNKNVVGGHFLKSHGHNGEAHNHGDAGYTSGEVALKDVKGESVHFSDTDGVNKAYHTGKAYQGDQHFDDQGKSLGQNVLNENFKKGHNVKSFKTSHHLDESGKTEEFYDEDHDEGGNYAFGGHAGKFGENRGSSFKGGFNDGKFNAGEHKKEGHFGNEYIVDKAHAGQGKFGGNGFAQNEESYGLNKGTGEQGLSGYQESNNFYKKYPAFY